MSLELFLKGTTYSSPPEELEIHVFTDSSILDSDFQADSSSDESAYYSAVGDAGSDTGSVLSTWKEWDRQNPDVVNQILTRKERSRVFKASFSSPSSFGFLEEKVVDFCLSWTMLLFIYFHLMTQARASILLI